MVLSRKGDSKKKKYSGWPFTLRIFLIRRQNGECKVRNFRRFLVGMSFDVPAFEVRVSFFTSNLKF